MNYLKKVKEELNHLQQNIKTINYRLKALDLALDGLNSQKESSNPYPVELAPETAIFIEDIEAYKAGAVTDCSVGSKFTEEQLNYLYEDKMQALYNDWL